LTKPDRLVIVGTIVKPHGIRGELVVEPLNDSPDMFNQGQTLRLFQEATGWRCLKVERSRSHQDRILLTLAGVTSRTEAETLRGLDLYTDEASLPSLPPGEFYHFQILDSAVLDGSGRRVGRVRAIHESGGAPLLEIDTGRGAFLLPFVERFVQSADLARAEIVIRDYEDLLDLES
jgi:16S rRNA processing protein RimM